MSPNIVRWVIIVAILLHSTQGSPVDLFNLPDEFVLERASDPGYRLPTDFTPESYEISLNNVNLTAQTFTGRTEITLRSHTNTSDLILNSIDITYQDIGIVIFNLNDTIEAITSTLSYNTAYEFLIVTATPPFRAGFRYRIIFATYTGRMDHNMRGFYTSTYVRNNQTVTLGTTQMQPTNARRVFPCFDEPGYKATFKLSIQRPEGDFSLSISNMRIEASDTNRWDHFVTTPPMSTYLLAFIVSNFQIMEESNQDGSLFRVVGRPGADGQGKYAFDEGQKLVSAMSDYMSLNYFNMGNNKMDQAAIPDFSAGAMENWGLLTYREAYLLSLENDTSVRYKQQISGILAHEITHMWFGDYVTCHWWSDTWLNEGFARLFQYKMTDMVSSTQFNMMTQFPALVLQVALLSDTSIRTAPLTNNEVNSPAEISGHFGIISYGKGASVLRMMEGWLGENNFRSSLAKYMADNALGVVRPSNLYAALQFNALNLNVTAVMSTWVQESGYPIISAVVNYETRIMTLSQKRAKKPWEADVGTLYQIPISYASASRTDFTNVAADFLMTAASANYTVNVEGEQWIVLNKQQIGYYRVNYDDKTWDILTGALLGNARTVIHQLNRGQIVDDVLNLAREDIIPYSRTLNVLDYLRNENSYAPWQSAYAGLAYIRQQLNPKKSLLERFDAHILVLMNNVTSTLGFTDNGDFLTQLFRLNTMNFACLLGHTGCVNYATEQFQGYLENNTHIPANHREFIYCSALRRGNATHFDKLWEKYKEENLGNEQLVIMTALGCTSIRDKIYEYLDEIFKTNSLIRNQDTMTPINGILNGNLDNPSHVLTYLENATHIVAAQRKLGSLSTLLTNLGSRLTGYDVSRFHELIIDNTGILSKDEIQAGMTTHYNLAMQGSYMITAGRDIEAWLDEKYADRSNSSIATSSVLLICLAFIVQLLNN